MVFFSYMCVAHFAAPNNNVSLTTSNQAVSALPLSASKLSQQPMKATLSLKPKLEISPKVLTMHSGRERKTSLAATSSTGTQEVNGTLQFSFKGPKAMLSNFTNFEGLEASCSSNDILNATKSSLTSVSLSNVYLDAAQFSRSLEGCNELQSIVLDNVSLLGNFTRVYLPKLQKFVYRQNANDKRDSYKSPETLKETLFFDLQVASSSWDVEKDLLNLGIDITIVKGGTRLIDVRRGDGEIYLNVKYCESVLLNAVGTYQSLTLINCNVTDAAVPVIPTSLKYLNVRNAVQRSPQLQNLLRRMEQLEELHVWLTFHCDWPGYELYLNLNDLPQTVRTVGINNVDSTYNMPDGITPVSSTSIKSLTVGDYTTARTVAQGFALLLPGLERLNVINMSDPTPAAGYNIIYTAIQMKVKEIAVVNLQRNYSALISPTEVELLTVESVLDHAGIPKAPLSSFIIHLRQNNNKYGIEKAIQYGGRMLTLQEQHQIRYNGLGFNKMDSWEDYIKWDSL